MTPRRSTTSPCSPRSLFSSRRSPARLRRAGAAAAVTTQTPVMGPSLLSAAQLAAWYQRHSGSTPKIPAFGGHPANDVAALAQVFIDEGKAEGVRGDIAFVQSLLETGWMGFVGSQIPADAYNYAGIYAFDGRTRCRTASHGDTAPSRCMGTPQHGVLVQIQLLRSYADPSTKTATVASSPRRRTASARRRCGSTSVGTTARAAS